jgi:protein-L-isoaspartate(D-aspartate) O-methyltransferase
VRPPSADLETQRRAMVDHQIKARGVRDPLVLAALTSVPRHLFVAEEDWSQAYADRPIPIGWGQTISQPYMVAVMTELLGPQPASRVLEIGTGSGYQTAVLAELCDQVFTVEVVPHLLQRARAILDDLGYTNVRFREGDGSAGWPEEAPYDGILVTCAPDEIPEGLLGQLKDGGRMVIPLGPAGGAQTLYLVTVQGERVIKRAVMGVRFVPLMPGGEVD